MSNSKENPADWDVATKLIRGGIERTPYGETAEAMFLTQSFVYDTAEDADARFAGDQPGFVYSRYANPTTKAFEDRLALLEGAQACRSTASGMAAVATALVGLVKAGDHVVSARALFGSCRWILNTYLARFGVETTFVDGTDLDAWRNAVRPNTRLFFLESPANPLLEIIDIAAVAQIAKAAGGRLVVDNVFATPLYQKPLELGADVVVYSATKHIDGQGRVLGGAILGDTQLLEESYKDFLRHTGPALSPFNAWVLLKGMETLQLRVRCQTETAAFLADRIAAHAKARRVFYPLRHDHPQYEVARRQMTGGGTLVALDLGDRQGAFNFLNELKIVDISNNLGDAKSMATHPSTTTHRSMAEEDRLAIGLTDGCVRLSVGLEGAADLWRDIERAGRRLMARTLARSQRRAASALAFTYEAETRGVAVRVRPSFLPDQSDPNERRWAWAYRIEIENKGADTVQLVSRHWVITDGVGRVEEVKGAGVVGEQPTIRPGEVYSYASGCPLSTSSGTMVGSYEMITDDGERFEAQIPAFSLDLPEARRVVN